MPTWQSIADWYEQLAKDRTAPDPSLKAKTAEVIKGRETQEDKAKAIFYYVQEKTRYVAIELGKSAYQPRTANSVLANKYGDCKDMATLLVAMMREAGITAYPVLLGGRRTRPERGDPRPARSTTRLLWRKSTARSTGWTPPRPSARSGSFPGSDRGCSGVCHPQQQGGVRERFPTA